VLITVGLLGLLASLDPLRPAVFVMVLRTDRGRINAIGFLVGWAFALAVLFTAGFVAFNAGAADRPSSVERNWLSILELVLAVVLLVVALRRGTRRKSIGTGSHTPAPIQRQLERLTPRRSSFLGVLIQPRSMTIAAAVIVARDRSGFASAAAALGVFALFSTGALLGLFTYFVRRPDHANRSLASLTERIERLGPTVVTVVCALAGCYLLVDAIRGLIAG
jgi:hypothetical protein